MIVLGVYILLCVVGFVIYNLVDKKRTKKSQEAYKKAIDSLPDGIREETIAALKEINVL